MLRVIRRKSRFRMDDHDSTKAVALDLASLNSEEFEKLVATILRAKCVPAPNNQAISSESYNPTVLSVLHSGRGADQGRDLLVTTVVNDGILIRQFKWVVQCKHYAKSGKSVQPSDFQNDVSFTDIVAHHHANGYLLVCSTIPSTNLQSHFERLTEQDTNPYFFTIWDETRVCEELNRHLNVMKQFFPEYHRRYYQPPFETKDIMKWAEESGAPEDALTTFKMALNKVVAKDRAQVSSEDSMEE